MLYLLLGLFVVCFFDYKYGKIPNPSVLLLALGAVAAAFIKGGVLTISEMIMNGIIVGMIFFPVFRIGALGAGDVKLLTVCAMYFEGNEVTDFIFITFLAAAAFAAIRMAVKREFRERLEKLIGYIRNCALSGRIGLYNEDRKELRKHGVCMAGPALIGVMCKLGGLF